MSAPRSFYVSGIVLKRSNVGETDRIVTVLSQENGKISVVAKGVRKVTSSKRSILEPGNIVKMFCIATKSMPLLTQATIIDTALISSPTLNQLRSLQQCLEIFDAIFVEEELDDDMYSLILDCRTAVLSQQVSVEKVRSIMSEILLQLGYASSQTTPQTIAEKVSMIAERQLNSYDYLTVK